MSADRYTTCPRCVHEYEAKIERLAVEIANDYPNLSQAAQGALFRVLKDERNLSEPDRNFREDYEFAHEDNDRTVGVVYKGHCSICDLGLKIEETYTIWDGVS